MQHQVVVALVGGLQLVHDVSQADVYLLMHGSEGLQSCSLVVLLLETVIEFRVVEGELGQVGSELIFSPFEANEDI